MGDLETENRRLAHEVQRLRLEVARLAAVVRAFQVLSGGMDLALTKEQYDAAMDISGVILRRLHDDG